MNNLRCGRIGGSAGGFRAPIARAPGFHSRWRPAPGKAVENRRTSAVHGRENARPRGAKPYRSDSTKLLMRVLKSEFDSLSFSTVRIE